MTEKINILNDRTEKHAEDNIVERHKDDWPKLNVSLYLAQHGGSYDTDGIAPYLEEADVLLYEDVGRTPEIRRLYDHTSKNPSTDIESIIDGEYYGDPIRGNAAEPLLRGLYGTGKAVGTLDIGKNDSDLRLENETRASISKIAAPTLSYKSALIMTRNYSKQDAALQAEREERMAENFEEEMEYIFKIRPDLHDKDSVNILISIGAFHAGLAQRLDNRGLEAKSNFSKDPDYNYSYPTELQWDYMQDVEPTQELIEDTLSTQIILIIVNRELINVDTPSDEITEFVRRYVASLSSEEQEELFNLYKAERLSIDNINNLISQNPNYMKFVKTGAEIEKANKNYHIRVKKLGKAVSH